MIQRGLAAFDRRGDVRELAGLVEHPLDGSRDLPDLAAHLRRETRGRVDHVTAPNCGRYGRFASSSASRRGSTSPIRPPTSGCASSAARTSARSPDSRGADRQPLVGLDRSDEIAHRGLHRRLANRVGAVAVDARRDLDDVVGLELRHRAVVADVDDLDVPGPVVEGREQLRGGLAVEGAAAMCQQLGLSVERRIGVHREQLAFDVHDLLGAMVPAVLLGQDVIEGVVVAQVVRRDRAEVADGGLAAG